MHRFAVVVAVLAFTSLSLPLSAQDLESLAGVRLRFDSPGVRAAAMAGASEASSDAFGGATNPAALARQTKRTAAIEARQTTSEMEFITGGTIGSFTRSSVETTSRGASAAAIVLPGRLANWAFYYDEPIDAAHDTRKLRRSIDDFATISAGVRGEELVPTEECIDPSGPSPCSLIAYFSAPAIFPVSANLRLRRYGAAAGRAFGRLSLGAGVQYAQLDQTLEDFQQTHDRRFTFNAGAQLDVTSRLRAGASYRSGAEFDGERIVIGPGGAVPQQSTFVTPSSYAAGLAYELAPNVTLAADAVRVRYSEMTPRMALNFTGTPVAPIVYAIPDVTELRAGAEWRLGTRVPVALRGGWWREPAHRVRAAGGPAGSAALLNEILLVDADENHVTAGFGIGDRVRLDAAVDRSERTTRASVGVAATF